MKHIRNRSAFTLIELLAAMAVLSLLVVMVGSLFDAATRTWAMGEEVVTKYDLGRSTVDQLYIDTQTAVADKYLPFAVFQDQNPNGGFDAIYMVSCVGHRALDADKKRDFSEVIYHVEREGTSGPARLMRRRILLSDFGNSYVQNYFAGGSLSSYAGLRGTIGQHQTHTDVIMDNLYSFDVIAYRDNQEMENYYSIENAPDYMPDKVEIRFVVLSGSDWNRIPFLTGVGLDDYIREKGAVFHMTVTFPSNGR